MKKQIIRNIQAKNIDIERDRLNNMDVNTPANIKELYNESDTMMKRADVRDFDATSLRNYSFVEATIPRLPASSPEVDSLIMAGKPVVITDTGLVNSARGWNLDYLSEHMGDGLNFVFQSKTHKFKYFDDKRLNQWPDFERPTFRHEVTFRDFVGMLRQCQNSDNRLYLQQTLNDTVGRNIVQDFVRFRWDWCTKYQRLCHWGTLTSNLLLVAMEGNITPCHYDEQENFFAQIQGYKRCTLFSPDQFECLYPYPVSHPCDRQSQVDLDNPDFEKYPKFRNVRAVDAIVGPGDVLYIPMYWWHNIESIKANHPTDSLPVTVSVNFWYKASPAQPKIVHSITEQQKVAVMRNIEKMLGEVLLDPYEVGRMLRTMVDGRYDNLKKKSSDVPNT